MPTSRKHRSNGKVVYVPTGSNLSTAGTGNSNVSELEAFRENASQLNAALEKAKGIGAAQLQYTDITGRTVNRYWNGATFTDRKSSLYETTSGKYKRTGIYKAKFKEPKNWKQNGSTLVKETKKHRT